MADDGSCVRLRPERPNHVWSYDVLQYRTHEGRAYRTLNIIDEFTKEALMIRVDRKLNSTDVLDALTDLFILRGPPEYIRSDNGPEFIAQKVRDWIAAVGAKTAYIEPGSPWEKGTVKASTLGSATSCSMRTVLKLKGGPNPNREIAHSLQHRQAAQFIGLSSACNR